MISTKEKAQELIRQFYSVGAVECKQCALIAVNEMLKVAYFIDDNKIYDYLFEVKQEIEKL
jgi:hypothetical protein